MRIQEIIFGLFVVLVPLLCSGTGFAQEQKEDIPLVEMNLVTGAVTPGVSDEEISRTLEEVNKITEEQRFMAAFSGFSGFMRKLREGKESGVRYHTLEFLPEQELNISKLAEDFDDASRRIRASGLTESDRKSQVRDLEKLFMSKLVQELEPFQLKQLTNWSLRVGLPKLVIQSGYGESIGLSETQRKNIEDKSEQLIQDLAAAIYTFKKRSADLVFDELTESQRKQLAEKLDMESVNNFAERAEVRTLVEMHDLTGSTKITIDKLFNPEATRDYSLRVWPEDDNERTPRKRK